MTAGLDQTTFKITEKEIKSETTNRSEWDKKKTKETYTEYGMQIAGHALFGWGFTWLRYVPSFSSLNSHDIVACTLTYL